MCTKRISRSASRNSVQRTFMIATIGSAWGILSSFAQAQLPPRDAATADRQAPIATSKVEAPKPAKLVDADGMVTARPGAVLRIGPSPRFYPVAIVETPQRLKVVDLTPRKGFLRVALPQGTPALVAAASCEAIDDRSIRITRPTRLIALHARSGPEASWKSLLDEPLRPGSRLEVVDVVRDRQGGIKAYIVAAPTDASGWIGVDQIVPLPEPAADAPSSDDAAGDGDEESKTDDPAGNAKPANETSAEIAQRPGDAGQDGGASLMEAMVPPGAEQGQGDGVEQPANPAPKSLATNAPATVIEQGPDADATTAREQEALDPAELEDLYQRARHSDSFEDELEALLAEHRRTLASLPDDPFNERLRRQLERRIAYLEARIAFRDGPERLAAQRATMPRISEQLREKLERLRAGNDFQLIGRLVVSRVYDGKRLPRLYRVRSADALGRTLGYVRPQEGQDMTPYLDRIVGIAGTIEDGPAGSRIVTPKRIELLDETP